MFEPKSIPILSHGFNNKYRGTRLASFDTRRIAPAVRIPRKTNTCFFVGQQKLLRIVLLAVWDEVVTYCIKLNNRKPAIFRQGVPVKEIAG